MATEQRTLVERFLGIPGTIAMVDGSGTDGVPDPERSDTAEGSMPAGETPGTFPHDLSDEARPAPIATRRPFPTIEAAEASRPERPDVWRVGRTTIATVQNAVRILSANPLRETALFTNEDGFVSVWLGPTAGSVLDAGSSRELAAGESYLIGHTAEVWAGPVAGASGAVELSYDEQAYSR